MTKSFLCTSSSKASKIVIVIFHEILHHKLQIGHKLFIKVYMQWKQNLIFNQ